jgi:hypothetical protein
VTYEYHRIDKQASGHAPQHRPAQDLKYYFSQIEEATGLGRAMAETILHASAATNPNTGIEHPRYIWYATPRQPGHKPNGGTRAAIGRAISRQRLTAGLPRTGRPNTGR